MAHCVRGWICASPLIKQNRKLGSDSVMEQSAMVPGVRGQETSVWVPASGVRHLGSDTGVGRPGCGDRSPASGVQY